MRIGKIAFGLLCAAAFASAQSVVPSGTKVRLRLEQTISSTGADPGQTVELSVVSDVRSRGVLLFQQGAPALGTIVPQKGKQPSLLSGVDFSIDKVRGADGAWIPVRYQRARSRTTAGTRRAGILSAGVIPSLWPSPEPVLIVTNRSVTLKKGVTIQVFTDEDHIILEH